MKRSILRCRMHGSIKIKGKIGTKWVYYICLGYNIKYETENCVKSVRIWSFSGPYFPAFGLNMERYSVSVRIQSECGKIQARKTPNTDSFKAGKVFVISFYESRWYWLTHVIVVRGKVKIAVVHPKNIHENNSLVFRRNYMFKRFIVHINYITWSFIKMKICHNR